MSCIVSSSSSSSSALSTQSPDSFPTRPARQPKFTYLSWVSSFPSVKISFNSLAIPPAPTRHKVSLFFILFLVFFFFPLRCCVGFLEILREMKRKCGWNADNLLTAFWGWLEMESSAIFKMGLCLFVGIMMYKIKFLIFGFFFFLL